MLSLHQLASQIHRERLARAEQARPARRYLASLRKSRRADQASTASRKTRPAPTPAPVQDGDL
jgi:hypothetical protein